ncbi:MAG: S9 family peptidase [Bryobacterales bacterium]|nr:S9 family peptidase [Bryobacterales bacterium]
MRKVAVLLFAVGLGFAQKRPVTHEDIWLMKRVGEPVVSPDGRMLVFSVTAPAYDPGKQSADLWLMPADGSAPARQVTFTRAAESGAEWSPDGTQIAFVTRRNGDVAAQAYVLPVGGGEARPVTKVEGGVRSVKWRPDGKAILFEADYDPLAADRKSRKWNARIYDAMPVRYWNAWLDEKKPHLFVQELAEGAQPVDLLQGTKLAGSVGFGGLADPLAGGQALHAVWAPDGKSVVFAAALNRTEMMYKSVETALFAVPATGGEPKQLTEPGYRYSRPQFSRTGDALYAEYERKETAGGRLYSLTRITRFAWPDTGHMQTVTGEWDRSVSTFAIANDGRAIYIGGESDGADQLFRVPSQGGAVERLYKAERGGYTAVKPVAGGLIALYQTSIQPPEIVRLDGGSHKVLTNFNADAVAKLDAPPPVHFWFEAKNGKRIHNLMFLPPAFNERQKYPLLIFPHGGPASMSKDAFSTRWNNYVLTSPGYVLLETNYTGSTGFGEKFADDIERDVLRGPAQEILEAIDEAIKRYPYIDGTRQAAAGASYGGYLMNWLNGHTTQFKCLINHAGAINNESQYGFNDGGIERELRMGGPIWEKGGQWNDQSPLRYSGSFKTPTLITQGELDYRVPVNESMTTFKILQRRQVPSRLVVFPDEGHWILKGENSRLHMQEVLGWLKRYL